MLTRFPFLAHTGLSWGCFFLFRFQCRFFFALGRVQDGFGGQHGPNWVPIWSQVGHFLGHFWEYFNYVNLRQLHYIMSTKVDSALSNFKVDQKKEKGIYHRRAGKLREIALARPAQLQRTRQRMRVVRGMAKTRKLRVNGDSK